MIILRDIALRRAEKALLQDAGATLLPGQRVALIGPNGCGKSSLFALLRGELTADAGSIEGLRDLRVAHMDQDVPASSESARDFVLGGDAAVAALLRQLQQQETRGDFTAAAVTHQALAHCDGYEAPRRAARLMYGLGFASTDEDRTLADFSGGWRVRLALARALMAPSDLLLLDEPTNHLDLDTALWLQDFLRGYAGTLLLISHDRDFIDACCSAVLHMEGLRLDSYRGGYSSFEEQRALRRAQARADADRQARRRAEIEDFVRRFRYKATKARQAQSRLKELERMGEASAAYEDSPFEFRFPDPPRARDPLLELRGAALGYDNKPVLAGVDLALRSGDRIALLGRNGAGKTTLLRGLCGELPLLAGARHCVDGCRIAYFDQQQVDTLDLEANALTHLQRITPAATEQSIRDFLGGFDFRGERAEMPVAPFSGGEKARLALALAVWRRPNVLILDEPTNHLDLDMRRALELALMEFAGATVLVSHDRHLLRSATDRLYRVAGGQLDPFEEDLESYEKALLKAATGSATVSGAAPPDVESAGATIPEDRRAQRQAAARRRQRLRPLQQTLARVEQRLDDAQSEMAALQEQLADPGIYAADGKSTLTRLLQEQGTLQQHIETLEGEWLAAQEALEALEAD